MNDTEKPPGASCETDEPQLPHFYGLSLFEYDVMALAVPGIVFMLLSYMLCSLLGFSVSKWTEWLTVSADWLREVVGATIMIVIAYLVGLSTDSIAGSEIVDWFARLIWKREDPGLDWDDVRLNVMRTRMPRNE